MIDLEFRTWTAIRHRNLKRRVEELERFVIGLMIVLGFTVGGVCILLFQ